MLLKNTTVANKLGSQASFFLIGNLFTLLVGFPLQVFVARKLGADGLGLFSLIEGVVVLTTALLAFGLAPTLVKFIPIHLHNCEYSCIQKLIKRSLSILLFAGVGAYLLVLYSIPIIISRWTILFEYRDLIVVMGILIPLSLIIFSLQQGLRGFQEIRYMVIGSSFLQLTIKAVLSVFLLSAGLQLMGYAWAVVVSVTCATIWMAVGLFRKVYTFPTRQDDVCVDKKDEWNSYAKTMYGNSLLSIGTQNLDRFLLGFFIGAAPVGVLVIVKQLQQIPVIFLQMFLAVAAPMFSAAHARNDIEEQQHIYHLTTDWVIRLSIPLFIFFLIFSTPLLNLYGDGFATNGKYALWIFVVSQIINLGFGPLGTLLNMCGMERRMLKLSIYQTIIQVMSIVLLVPKYGIIGAALSVSIGLIFLNIAAMRVAQKQIGLSWRDPRYKRWVAPIVISTLAGIAMYNLLPFEPGAAVLGLYLVVLYFLFQGISLVQGLHDDDRQLLNHLRRKMVR